MFIRQKGGEEMEEDDKINSTSQCLESNFLKLLNEVVGKYNP